MDIVIETSVGVDPSAIPSLRQVISTYQLSAISTPFQADEHTYHYYTYSGEQEVEAVINALLQVPGVTAAYTRPSGMPPAM